MEISSNPGWGRSNVQKGKMMDSPVSPEHGEQSLHAESRSEIGPQTRNSAERIRTSVAQSTQNSIEDLEKLTSELQELQQFLKAEVDRVQGEIESALGGINIIMETIAPWKSPAAPLAPQTNGRGIRKM
jgi:peptidoglycan hydrolase CwlO-like protein